MGSLHRGLEEEKKKKKKNKGTRPVRFRWSLEGFFFSSSLVRISGLFRLVLGRRWCVVEGIYRY